VSIWDKWAQEGNIQNGDTGDVASDSYNNYMEDIKILTHLGVIKHS